MVVLFDNGRLRAALTALMLAVAMAGLLAGCAGAGGAAAPAGTTVLPSGVSPDAAANSDLPRIPSNAAWTLYCQVVRAPDHIARAKGAKAALVKATGMNDWYVVHAEGYSGVYYGFYRTIDDDVDRAEAARAQADRRRIMNFRDAGGEMPFSGAVFVPLAQADPPAPRQWDLTNAPPEAFWSVQIAAYADSPLRKQYAVDAVKAAREMGIPAYFYHGETVSSVCIGTWPRSAVREQQTAREYNTNPDQPLLVMSHAIPGLPSDLRDREGNKVQTVAPNVEIADPTLMATLRQYPYHAVNGEQIVHKITDPASGQVKTKIDPSFLVEIPRRAPSLLGGPPPTPPTAPAAPLAPPPPTPREPGAQPGRLRSIGG